MIFTSRRLSYKTRNNILRVLSVSVPLIGMIGIAIAISFITHDLGVIMDLILGKIVPSVIVVAMCALWIKLITVVAKKPITNKLDEAIYGLVTVIVPLIMLIVSIAMAIRFQ